jgi:hypothetical protein
MEGSVLFLLVLAYKLYIYLRFKYTVYHEMQYAEQNGSGGMMVNIQWTACKNTVHTDQFFLFFSHFTLPLTQSKPRGHSYLDLL